MWFKVQPAEASFVDRAKKHFTYDFFVEADPLRVFELITRPAGMGKWMPSMRSGRWLTAAPHGLGSEREVSLASVTVQERIVIWEPGERFAFTLTRANVPLVTRMVEDFRLTAQPGGGTRVRWTIAYQSHLAVKALEGRLRKKYSRLFERASHQLSRAAKAAA